MAKLRLDILTAERIVYSDEVDLVVAPGIEGQLGILPHHAPLLTALQIGELLIRKDGEEFTLVVHGGFLEVLPDRVVILADACEREEEIDMARAEEARRRAEELLGQRPQAADLGRAEAALRRSWVRLKVAQRRRRERGPS